MTTSGDSWRSERGVIFVLVAMLLFVIFGFAAFTVDAGQAMDEARRLQIAADAGSISASRLLAASATPGATISSVTSRACSIANFNGLQNSDVLSVECGRYVSNAFTTTCTGSCGSSPSCNCFPTSGTNSVRVTTRKPVLTTFGRLFKVNSIVPSMQAVSLVASAPTGCLRPFGVETAVLWNPQVQVGATFSVGSGAPGNWGKLNIGQGNQQQAWVASMASGDCSSTISVNQAVPYISGNAGTVGQGFVPLVNQQFRIARTSNFPNGQSGGGNITVLEFLLVTYLGDNQQNGNGWTGYLRLDGRNASLPSGGGSSSDPSLVR